MWFVLPDKIRLDTVSPIGTKSSWRFCLVSSARIFRVSRVSFRHIKKWRSSLTHLCHFPKWRIKIGKVVASNTTNQNFIAIGKPVLEIIRRIYLVLWKFDSCVLRLLSTLFTKQRWSLWLFLSRHGLEVMWHTTKMSNNRCEAAKFTINEKNICIVWCSVNSADSE